MSEFVWGYGDILKKKNSLWCSNPKFNKYKCAIFRTGKKYDCLYTGKCWNSKFSTICKSDPNFFKLSDFFKFKK